MLQLSVCLKTIRSLIWLCNTFDYDGRVVTIISHNNKSVLITTIDTGPTCIATDYGYSMCFCKRHMKLDEKTVWIFEDFFPPNHSLLTSSGSRTIYYQVNIAIH